MMVRMQVTVVCPVTFMTSFRGPDAVTVKVDINYSITGSVISLLKRIIVRVVI